MTSMVPEIQDPDLDLESLADHEFDIICDVHKMVGLGDVSPCKGDPAKWIGWRVNCCPQSPTYRLLCVFCKRTYQNWQAQGRFITCVHCGTETGGYISYTPLKASE